MAANKTQPNQVSLADFLAGVTPPERRADADVLIEMMRTISGEPPVMWGPSIIGFGSRHYVYDSGREGDTPRIAFSPRKAELVLYVGAARDNIAALLTGLGRHKTGKGCLYIKRLSDVDAGVLQAVVRQAWDNGIDTPAG